MAGGCAHAGSGEDVADRACPGVSEPAKTRCPGIADRVGRRQRSRHECTTRPDAPARCVHLGHHAAHASLPVSGGKSANAAAGGPACTPCAAPAARQHGHLAPYGQRWTAAVSRRHNSAPSTAHLHHREQRCRPRLAGNRHAAPWPAHNPCQRTGRLLGRACAAGLGAGRHHSGRWAVAGSPILGPDCRQLRPARTGTAVAGHARRRPGPGAGHGGERPRNSRPVPTCATYAALAGDRKDQHGRDQRSAAVRPEPAGLERPQPELLWAACGDAQAKALRRWMQEHQPQMRCQISSYWR